MPDELVIAFTALLWLEMDPSFALLSVLYDHGTTANYHYHVTLGMS